MKQRLLIVLISFFLTKFVSLNAQSYLSFGIGFNNAPVYEPYFEDSYNFSGSPSAKYQYNWKRNKNRSLRLGIQLVYHQGRETRRDTTYDHFSNDLSSIHTTAVAVNRISSRLSLVQEHRLHDFAVYYGGLIQVPVIERMSHKNYTWLAHGQLYGDYYGDFERKWLHFNAARIYYIFMGAVGVRYDFNVRNGISLDYSMGFNKRHSLFLSYSFSLGKVKASED